ncbi:GGDEF domain-containing protein [Halomonas mongoliensis]|jgi:diguanylate cyclase (GGDEF)-like protein|uniref:diguanylate cyclase n=1 Tax=Halomonas mongoliensis TaxID=321265 RepID=A0ABU1GLN3_9GAMM|nr:GGDEF domain-containing protein [Halomonas mongoliensis]MDR5892735.1 GGDEF domain-containing protein [Halomonas mongoliensis]
MAVNLGNAGLLNWRAEFHDPKMEALFRHSILSHNACQLSLALCVIALLFLVFALADYSLLGKSEGFLLLLSARLVTVTTCLLLALAVWRQPALAQRALPVNLVGLFSITVLLLTLLVRPLHEGLHVASLVVASMALYLFLPNRLPWMLAGNAYLLVGFVGTTLFSASLPPVLIMTSLLLLLFTNLLGWLSITHLKRLKRLQFSMLLEERSANRRLKEEIAERKALEARLRYMACTDGLTGVANRRHFFELATQELRRARRDGTPLAICMVDVDLFKRLNDHHGHAVGDMVLTRVADCCRSVLRECDVVGRYGGEEFVIVLPLADLATAAIVGERLRQQVSALQLPMLPPQTPLSVTVGISQLAPGESRLDPALLRADRALYAGKAAGRNCVVVAGAPPPGASHRYAGALWRPELTILLDEAPATAAAVQAAAVPAAEPPPDRF